MKKLLFLTFFTLVSTLTGCNILGGDSDAVEKVSLEDLQGCRYFEYNSPDAYDCTEICISDSTYYNHYRHYVRPNTSWSLYKEYTDSAIVRILDPEEDGKFESNVQLIYTYRSSPVNITADNLLSNYHQGSEGWTLCNE